MGALLKWLTPKEQRRREEQLPQQFSPFSNPKEAPPWVPLGNQAMLLVRGESHSSWRHAMRYFCGEPPDEVMLTQLGISGPSHSETLPICGFGSSDWQGLHVNTAGQEGQEQG